MVKRGGFFVDAGFARGKSADVVRDHLRGIFASTAFDFDEATRRVSLQGSTGAHLKADRELDEFCDAHEIALCRDNRGYLASKGSIDVCLEDGLTGMLIARALLDGQPGDWVVLHLDDHADLMPTLLVSSDDGGLSDPETGHPFHGTSEECWHRALARGAVTIGSYLTPLFHEKPSGTRIHIRHLRPRLPEQAPIRMLGIQASTKTYAAFGSCRFAAVETVVRGADTHGTYLQAEQADEVLGDVPSGRVIVHIDLDVFVNDFNGDPMAPIVEMTPSRRATIRAFMDRFFSDLSRLNRTVERWIIATSPGFCAARHWSWLLSELTARISALTGEERHTFLG